MVWKHCAVRMFHWHVMNFGYFGRSFFNMVGLKMKRHFENTSLGSIASGRLE